MGSVICKSSGYILAGFAGRISGHADEVSKEPPEGALSKKVKDLIFTILDCVSGDVNGTKALAVAAFDARLTMKELVESFVIGLMVTGIPTLRNLGVQAINAAEERLEGKGR